MDAKVSARFFRVSPPPDGKIDFPDQLLNIMKAKTAGERERVLDGGVTLRLERCSSDGQFIAGEFCRKQTVNIPPKASAAGLAPVNLGEGSGLGHTAAFRYHRPTRVLLLQHNAQCANPIRLGVYLAFPQPDSFFVFSPILRKDAWERFKDKSVRKFEVRFASPENLEALDEANVAAASGVKMLADAYGGMAVKFSVSVGRNKKASLVKSAVQATINSIVGSEAKVRTLRVQTGKDDGGQPIDFLKEHLKSSKELDLPENDPMANYAKRSAYLKDVFSDNLVHLIEMYKPKAK